LGLFLISRSAYVSCDVILFSLMRFIL